ncbi:MAG: PatB family C-S lyase [Lachnospiraceae bacterium]|nr:PatB family C-S lyase [Lachnospiraceae bacterium]
MAYNFDQLIDRHGTNCGKWEFMQIQNPYAGSNTLPFWVADMDFPCPDGVIEALHERVDNKAFGYSANFTGEFFRSVCGWFQHRFDWYVNSRDVFYCNGIVPAINYLIQIMTHEGDQVLLQPPIYRPFYKKINCTHRTPVENQLVCRNGHYEIDFEDFEQKVKDPKTTLFLLCSPHNPTGRVWTEEELRSMAELCFANGVRIISDEIHHDIVAPGVKHIPLAKLFPEHQNEIITCASVSKTFNLAGLAYSNIVICDPHLKALWNKLAAGDYGVMYPNPLSITAIQAAYATGEPWIDQLNGYLHDNLVFVKEYLAKHLPRAKMNVPEGTYFAWIDAEPYLRGVIRADLDSYLVQVADVLIESGLEGEPIFGPGAENYLRMNTACPRSMLEEGLRRMCIALDRVFPGDMLEDVIYETPWNEGSLAKAVDRPTFLLFLRYYGCTICQLDMKMLKAEYDKITAAGAKAMVVLQSDPAGIRKQIPETTFPYEIICDPEQKLYEKYNIAPALTKEKMADGKVLAKIGKARASGLVHGAHEGEELQLPAVFLVTPGLAVKQTHYGRTPADMPDTTQFLHWLDDKEGK